MKKRIGIILVCMLLFTTFTVVFPVETVKASGNTFYVGGSGPGNYTNIQSAIDAANSGDIVFVYSGTYYEHVTLNKKLNVIGENKTSTLLDGSGWGNVVFITSDWVNVSGFTIQKGVYGVQVSTAKNCKITNNNALNNDYYGIYLYSSSHVTVTGNNANSNNYNGIMLYYSSTNTVTGNKVSNNGYQGIYLLCSSNSTVTGNNVSNNGEGIRLTGSSNSSVMGNNAYSNNGTGIVIEACSNGTVVGNNAYSNNRSGINLARSNKIIVMGNNAYSNNRSGIILDYSCTYCTVTGNNVSNNGWEGIRLSGSNLIAMGNYVHSNYYYGIVLYYASNSTVTANDATDNGHGIILQVSNNNTITRNSANSNNEHGIYLEGSNTNTVTDNNANSNKNRGIFIIGSSNTVTGNNANSNNDYGIVLVGSNNTVTGNNANSNNRSGIILDYSCTYCTVTGNNVSNNGWEGIRLSGSNLIAMGNNVHSNYYYGIVLYYASNSTVTANDATDNGHGIILQVSNNNTITDNNANSNNNCGIYLEGSNTNTVTGNNANSNNNRGIVIGGSSNTVTGNNANSNNDYGIVLVGSNNTATGNNASNNGGGIVLGTAHNNTVTGNNANSNNGTGIFLLLSSNNIVTGNDANSNNYCGIILYASSNKNTVTSNNATNNGQVGIHLDSASYNTIMGNNANSNKDGISLIYNSSTNNIVIGNNANSNNDRGIYLGSSSNNTVTGNYASNNSDGIVLSYSNNNIIYNNYFSNINNFYDNGNNIWNIGKTPGTNIIGGLYLGGNYWSDYTGADTDGDGLGNTDLPYGPGDYLPLDYPNLAPIADFTFFPDNPTYLDTVQFTDTSTDTDGTITSWSWDFGDGDTSTEQNPTHQYITPSDYTICLNVTDDDGASDIICKQITIIPSNQKPEFGTPIPNDGAINQPVELLIWSIQISDPDGDLFDWSIECSNGQAISETDDTNGTKEIHLGGLAYNTEYTVCVNATDPEGSGETNFSSYTFFTANGPPCTIYVDDDYKYSTPGLGIDKFINIQYALDHVCPGGTIIVYDGEYDEDLIIDDDNTGITIKGAYECFPTSQAAVIRGHAIISVNDVTIKYLEFTPTTDAAITVMEGITGTKLEYNKFRRDCVTDAIGVQALGSSIVETEHNWWGEPDGPKGGIMNDGKTANGNGVKNIGQVLVEPWIGIHAEITEPIGTIEVELGTPLTFDATGSFAYSFGECAQLTEIPMQYLWDFGDGSQSTNMIATHVFEQPGTYVVTLMVDSPGMPGLYSNFMYDWAYVTIHVITEDTALTANADGGNLGGYETIVNEPIQLYGDAYGGNGDYTWHWNFGDQTTDSNLQNPIHTYTKSGTYTVTLSVFSDGETATDTAKVTVYDIDELFVTINDANTIAGIETMFTARIKGGTPPYIINWDFGDGTTSQETNPIHIYNNPGNCTITVTVTDDKQKTATDTATITVDEENIIEEAEIKEVKAGLGVKATIDAGENNCHWQITVEGKVFLGGENSGTINPNTQETVRLGFSIALGKVNIVVTANEVQKEYTAFALGPLFLSLKEA